MRILLVGGSEPIPSTCKSAGRFGLERCEVMEIATQQGEARADASVRFEPEITAFACMYCGYAALDAAGAMRSAYPANLKVVRLPCAGKVDILYVLQAFEEGADGVMLVACPIGNCHHVRGNQRAVARLQRAKQLLEKVGLEGERIHLVLVSGGQGGTVAREIQSHVERVRALGPNPLREK